MSRPVKRWNHISLTDEFIKDIAEHGITRDVFSTEFIADLGNLVGRYYEVAEVGKMDQKEAREIISTTFSLLTRFAV